MFLPPIIDRELRTALRSTGALKARFWAAAAAAFGTAFALLLSLGFGASVWRGFHKYLFLVAIYLAVVRLAQHAAGLFAEERRNQTLGLIYLTGISSLELFVTKFFGGLLVASGELLALVPFIALPFLSGGVSLDLFVATAAALPTLLFFTMSLTIMVSILCSEESQALVWIAAIIAVISLAAPAVYSLGLMIAGAPPFSQRWLCLSPAYGPYLIFNNFGTAGVNAFWLATVFTWLWSAFFVGLAGWLLHRHWRDDPDAGLWASLKGRYTRWLRRFRDAQELREVLPANPFQWLTEHNRRSVAAAWLTCGGILILWLLGWATWRERWPFPANFYATAFIMIMVVDTFQTHAAASHVAAHRREGLFELLLTTPLQPLQIVEGQIEGLAAQFRPLRRALGAVFIAMIVGGFYTRSWTAPAVVTYLSFWGLLIFWAATNRRRSLPTIMWVALNSARTGFAVTRSRGFNWVWAIHIFNLKNIIGTVSARQFAFPTGSDVELTICIGAVLIVILVVVFQGTPPELHDRLVDEMRAIVQEPVPSPNDPRFKKWNIKERLPASEP